MTPSTHYTTILTDVERFLQERAYRYFIARYHGQADEELLKVQCDIIAMVVKLYLEPHVQWFEEYEARQQAEAEAELLTIDLAPEVVAERTDNAE